MKDITKSNLREAQKYCEDNDKSFGFMVQYMQDTCGVSFDCAMKFLREQSANAKAKQEE